MPETCRHLRGRRRITPGFGGILMLVFFFFVVVNARAQTSPSMPSTTTADIVTHDDFTIAPGDLLTITVFDTPELSGPVHVSNTGMVDLPLIGSIHLAGLSTFAAAELVRNRLMEGNYLRNPQVGINFVDFGNHNVLVVGEVARPGPIPLTGIRTLWEVVSAAGGATVTAGTKITIIPGDGAPSKEIAVDWSRDLAGQPNPAIKSGDTVQVSRAGIVYVVGQVGRQGGYPISHQRMTASQVVALAEGIKYTSKASHTRLIRLTPSGRTVTEIDLNAMIQGKIPDITLVDSDILYVPNSAAKVIITRGVEAAVGISSQLLIYSQQTR